MRGFSRNCTLLDAAATARPDARPTGTVAGVTEPIVCRSRSVIRLLATQHPSGENGLRRGKPILRRLPCDGGCGSGGRAPCEDRLDSELRPLGTNRCLNVAQPFRAASTSTSSWPQRLRCRRDIRAATPTPSPRLQRLAEASSAKADRPDARKTDPPAIALRRRLRLGSSERLARIVWTTRCSDRLRRIGASVDGCACGPVFELAELTARRAARWPHRVAARTSRRR